MPRHTFQTNVFLACLLAAFYFSMKADAQSVFNSSDYATLDDSFMVSNVSVLAIGDFDYTAAGDSITWDYSTLEPVSQRIRRYTDPNRSGYAAAYFLSCNTTCYGSCYNDCVSNGGVSIVCAGTCSFNCNATCFNNWSNHFDLAELSNDSISLIFTSLEDIFNFYDHSAGALSQVAIGARLSNFPIVVEFQNPDRIYSFPIEYGKRDSSFSDYAFQLDSLPGLPAFPLGYSRHQERHNEVEGWGTLITPYGVFENVLKMKTTITSRDTVTFGNTTQPLNILPPTVEYKWFTPEFGIPLLKVTASLVNGNLIYQSLEFIDTIRCFEPAAIFGYQPFPAIITGSDTGIDVSFYSLSINGNEFTWNFGDTASSQNTGTGSTTSHFFSEDGIYTVELTTCNTVCANHICDVFTLPVLIIDLSDPDTSSTGMPMAETLNLTLTPNPFSDRVLIHADFIKNEQFRLAVYDLSGKVAFVQPLQQLAPGRHTFEIDLKHLPAGIYVAGAETETGSQFFKLMKTPLME